MNRVLFNTQEHENEESIIFNLRPELNRISYNTTRASIIHLLVKSKELNHSLSVEEIAYKLGKRHSVIIHHLEKLQYFKIVNIVKSLKHGEKERRSIWGLNLSYPNLIQIVYSHMLRTFYTASELDRLSSINKDARSEIGVV